MNPKSIKIWSAFIRRYIYNLMRFFATAHANHPYHVFIRYFLNNKNECLQSFFSGQHKFEPMIGYNYYGKIEPRWNFLDRMFIMISYRIIKPTFKHIIAKTCKHLLGPSAIKSITHRIKNSLEVNDYRYVIRGDIKSYYASIDRGILTQQIKLNFDDPIMVNYLSSIVDNIIDRGGVYDRPEKGIPRNSSLSGFFAALYLKPLDLLFEGHPEILYLRYNDDWIILCKTKSQFAKAKKRLFAILKKLKLKISPTKTRRGPAGISSI